MTQVKQGSKKVSHRYGKGRNGRDSYEITLLYTRRDIRKFLNDYLLEIGMYQITNKFTENELIELFRTRLFELIPDKSAQDMAEWAFDISLRQKYITTNRWDREEPTIYFIDKVIVTMRPGRKGRGQVEEYEKSKENIK